MGRESEYEEPPLPRKDEVVDVCIIGAGAGGASVAYALQQAHVKNIVVLEKGVWRNPSFNPPGADVWDVENDNDELSTFERGFSLPANPGEKDFTRVSFDGGQTFSRLRIGRVLGLVGGYTVVYAGAYWRFRREDFKKKTLYDSNENPLLARRAAAANLDVSMVDLLDWPMPKPLPSYQGKPPADFYDVLEPYYTIAETVIGASGEWKEDPTTQPSSPGFPHEQITRSASYNYLPALPYHEINKLLEAAARECGWTPFHVPLGISSVEKAPQWKWKGDGLPTPGGIHLGKKRPPNELRPCVSCNYCSGYPCVWHSKNSVDEALLMGILTEPNIRIYTGVTVGRISSNTESGLRTVFYAKKEKGKITKHQIKCKAVVLAANAIQSPRILLNSKFDELPGAGAIGRYLTFHVDDKRGGFFEKMANVDMPVMVKKLAILDHYYPRENENFVNHASIQTGSRSNPIAFARNHGPDQWLRYRKFHEVQTIVEDLPQRTNQVRLDPFHADEFGDPRAEIVHHFHGMDLLATERTLNLIAQLLQKAAAELAPPPKVSDIRPNGSHLMGSLRMGTDPKTSAVDANCVLHGTENVFVADGSVFTSSAGLNPCLTIEANAFRVADYIFNKKDQFKIELREEHREAKT